MTLLRTVFNNENIGSLSSAWGHSWNHLENRFLSIQKLKPTEQPSSDRTSVLLNSTEGPISGAKSDFIRFDFSSNLRPSAEADLEITWVSEHGTGNARLRVANGVSLVPLGLFPDWLASRNISDVKIQPHSATSGLTYAIRNPELLRLKD